MIEIPSFQPNYLNERNSRKEKFTMTFQNKIQIKLTHTLIAYCRTCHRKELIHISPKKLKQYRGRITCIQCGTLFKY